MSPKPHDFGTFVIGLDHLPFRARILTTSPCFASIDRSSHLSLTSHTHAHARAHTHTLPSPSSLVTLSFTLTLQWTPLQSPIASQDGSQPARSKATHSRASCIHRRSTPITTPCPKAVKSLCAYRSPHRPRSLSLKGSQFVLYAPVSYSHLDHLAFPSRSLNLPLPYVLSSVARGFFCT